MNLSDYTYILPPNKIATHAPKKRGQAKLLVVSKNSTAIQDRAYSDCIEYLQPGDVLVLNNTKVIKARLFATDSEGKQYELVLLEQHGIQQDNFVHQVLYRGKLKVGDVLRVQSTELKVLSLQEGGIASIKSTTQLDILAESQGTVPLPPYMKRTANKLDEQRYQTEFARTGGSVAAPTASLNMTLKLIEAIKAKGVKVVYLTLHVGLGTFLPIRIDDITRHIMHSEWYSIPKKTAQTIQDAKRAGCKVTAVGTTVARTLEFAAADILSTKQSLSGEADIFIYPGYQFKLVDQLITNFHAPKSTVLMLTAAFAGWPHLQNAYQHALVADYHFLSYGDSMLVI